MDGWIVILLSDLTGTVLLAYICQMYTAQHIEIFTIQRDNDVQNGAFLSFDHAICRLFYIY